MLNYIDSNSNERYETDILSKYFILSFRIRVVSVMFRKVKLHETHFQYRYQFIFRVITDNDKIQEKNKKQSVY